MPLSRSNKYIGFWLEMEKQKWESIAKSVMGLGGGMGRRGSRSRM